MIIRKYMIPVYGRLVMAGVYTMDLKEKEKKLVPETYMELVAEWLARQEEYNRGESL
jgi:hypothetical protein|nr:MAG TPA: hypothetical protein [Caudoviricetes sp.]